MISPTRSSSRPQAIWEGLRNVAPRAATGPEPGSITSVHAGSCALAFEQMSLMIRESGAGGGLRMDEIKGLLGIVIDVIVQFDRDERGRVISEILYEPRRQRLAERGAAA